MNTKKILLSIATISILYTGCTEEKVEDKEIKTTQVVTEEPKQIEEIQKEEKKTQIVVKKEEPIKKIVIAPNEASLFKKCASCHGQNAEKKALNKSEIIKDWEASKIATALKGYRDGTYGGDMKALMKPQVANLSDKDIELLSIYIADFK